jgi:hypothetical protein
MNKIIRLFIFSAGLLLLFTSVAKLISVGGSARIWEVDDPILHIELRHLFWLVGLLELVVSAICFFSKQVWLAAGLVAWLSSIFCFYRLGLVLIGFQKPCPCLGNLTEALHISLPTAALVMRLILAYLFIGSYSALFSLIRLKKAASRPIQRSV